MKKIGSYVLLGDIASGGMASVHLGRMSGAAGFTRTVAIKRLHPQYARDPEFVSMFLDEARLAARVRHPNVVPTLDVVAADGELFLVMEYVEGESLSRLLHRFAAQNERLPLPIVASVLAGTLHGLHAAHEAKGDYGESLDIVHRDVSPQNMMVGADGMVRVLDFGIAKAAGRFHTTREGTVKGKLPYMAPEHIRGQAVSRRTDISAAGVVLWECLVGERLFHGDEAHILERVLLGTIPAPSSKIPGIPPALDTVVARATARTPSERYETAADMAQAIERAVRPALASEIAQWLDWVAGHSLKVRAARAAEQLQSDSDADLKAPPVLSPLVDPVNESTTMLRTPTGWARFRGRSRLVPAAVLVALLGAGATVLAMRSAASPSAAAPAPSSDDTSRSATLAPASAVAPPPASAAPEEPRPVASSKASPVASPAASSPPVASARPTPSPTPTPKPRPQVKRVDCTIPFTVNAQGERTYRRECLGR